MPAVYHISMSVGGGGFAVSIMVITVTLNDRRNAVRELSEFNDVICIP
jgi:hypothetical protein